jgi:hypothetical protein
MPTASRKLMREHPSSHQLKLYQKRSLAPDLFLTVHRHVSACPSCNELCGGAQATEEDYANLVEALMPEHGDAPYHLTESEMVDYVGQRLDTVDAESAESHLAVCSQCAGVLKELRAGAAHGPVAVESKTKGHDRPSRLASLIGPLGVLRRPALLASLALIALAAILAAFLIKRADEDGQVMRPADRAESTKRPDQAGTLPTPVLGGEVRPSEEGRAGQNADGMEKGRGVVESPSASPGASDAARGSAQGIESDPAIAALLSLTSRRAITSALTEQRLEVPPVLAELRGKSSTLLGEPGAGQPFVLLSPTGKVVQSARPTFRWTPLKGAGSYLVTVTDDKLNEVARSGPITKTEWSPGTPLKRGRVYSWQVTALKDGQAITSPVMPAPLAKFMILDAARDAELKRVRGVAPRYHLGLGVLYAHAGLLDEAEREFRKALKADPGSSTVAKLLQSVRSMAK